MASLGLFICIALVLVVTGSATCECPSNTPTGCIYSDEVDGFTVSCEFNSTNGKVSEFSIVSRPKKFMVRCNNSPGWFDVFKFYLCKLGQGLPPTLEYVGCNPPGLNDHWTETRTDKVAHLYFNRPEKPLTRKNMEVFSDRVELLSLVNSKFETVDFELLNDFKKLELLELRNTIIDIPKNFFNNTLAVTLNKLYLVMSGIESLRPDAFTGLKNLSSLDLWRNKIGELHEDVFSDLSNLTFLNLQDNKLNDLPSGIFRKNPNLQVINLSLNNISSLAGDIFRSNPKIVVFRMNQNKQNLTLQPGLFAENPELKSVRIMNSNLCNLTAGVFSDSETNLEEVVLSGNKINKLPVNFFGNATNLKNLDLKNNFLTELPDNFFINNKNLQRLDLSGNQIRTINELTFIGLVNLRELIFERNGLASVHISTFSPLKSLQVAKFKMNELTLETNINDGFAGPISPFYTCHSLRELELAHNNITEVKGDWLFTHTRLQKLDLSYNKIESISARDFQFFSKNRVSLDLSHNEIYEVDLELMEVIFNPSALANEIGSVNVKLHNNPLYCNCRAYDLLRYAHNLMHSSIRKHIRLDISEMKCQLPSWYNSFSPVDIRPQEFKCLTVDPQYNEEDQPPRTMDPCRINGECACYQRPHDKTLLIDCRERNLTSAPEILNPLGMSRIFLDLEGNHLEETPSMFRQGYQHVAVLNLAGNKIKNVRPDVVSPKLEELILSHNNLTRLDKTTMESLTKSDLMVLLGKNPWKCECNEDTRNFLAFVHAKKSNVDAVYCGSDDDAALFQWMTVEDLCRDCIWYTPTVWAYGAVCGVLLALVLVAYKKFKKEIKSWLYFNQCCMCLVTEDELDEDKKYDAFISYSHKDEDFVEKQLVPKLEGGSKPYKLCIHARDWLAGEWIPRQIERSVDESKRTIVVLSKNFIESKWSKFEFQAAHKKAVKEKRNRIIVVLFEDIGPLDNLDLDLRTYLEMNTYVKWGDPWFWEKLMYAMPHTSHAEAQNKKNMKMQVKKVKSTEHKIKKKLEEVKIMIAEEKDKLDKGGSFSGSIYTLSKNIGRSVTISIPPNYFHEDKTHGNI